MEGDISGEEKSVFGLLFIQNLWKFSIWLGEGKHLWPSLLKLLMRHGIFDLKQFSLCAFLRTTLAAWDQVCLSRSGEAGCEVLVV